ncbi:30S ribosomal protein S18 [Candidatus Peregrinibacteria bacterium]|nr:MAG: 30S ribosomal protein S18 [Candidatus Peregrinibacteria bacterium]
MKYVSSDKTCPFKADNTVVIDYKNVPLLRRFVDYYGRIKKSYYKGTTRQNQSRLARSVKRARHMGLLSFTR